MKHHRPPNSTEINKLILELAKINDWLSIKILTELTGKGITTLTNYIKKEIPDLLDNKDFIEYVARGKDGKGKGKTVIEKYKLKPGLDNLASVLSRLEEKEQRELFETKYYQDLKPSIVEKLKKSVNSFYIQSLANDIIKSPLAVYFLLNLKDEHIKIIEKSDSFANLKKVVRKRYAPSPQRNQIYVDMPDPAVFLLGIFFLSTLDNLMDNPDYFKSD